MTSLQTKNKYTWNIKFIFKKYRGVSPVSHNALDRIAYAMFAPLFQWFYVVLWNGHITCVFYLSCVCASSEKLDICHVGRPFSRDRLILVLELDAVRQLM